MAEVQTQPEITKKDIDNLEMRLGYRLDKLEIIITEVDRKFERLSGEMDRRSNRIETMYDKLENRLWIIILAILGLYGTIIFGLFFKQPTH